MYCKKIWRSMISLYLEKRNRISFNGFGIHDNFIEKWSFCSKSFCGEIWRILIFLGWKRLMFLHFFLLNLFFSVLVENHALEAGVVPRVGVIFSPFYIHRRRGILLVSYKILHHTTAPAADDAAGHCGNVGGSPHLQPHAAVEECQLVTTRTVLP